MFGFQGGSDMKCSDLRGLRLYVLSSCFFDLNVWDWVAYELCSVRVMCLMVRQLLVISYSVSEGETIDSLSNLQYPA